VRRAALREVLDRPERAGLSASDRRGDEEQRIGDGRLRSQERREEFIVTQPPGLVHQHQMRMPPT
jgi:hypothetical protein